MKQRNLLVNIPLVTLLMFILFTLNSCSAIEGIFKAGVWVGVLIVAVVIGVIIWIISKAGGSK